MRAASHFWLLGSEALNVGQGSEWRFLSTGRSQHIKCYTSGQRTYTNVQDRVVSERSGNLNQGKRGDSLASQEASHKRLVVLAALSEQGLNK